jgi:hypothetical protein
MVDAGADTTTSAGSSASCASTPWLSAARHATPEMFRNVLIIVLPPEWLLMPERQALATPAVECYRCDVWRGAAGG